MEKARVFDGKSVHFVADGTIATGLAEGDAIECGPNADAFTETVGMQGDVEWSETNNKTGYFKIKLQQTSPTCALYEKWAREGTIVPVQLVDLNTGGINASCTQARVKKTAVKKYGPKSTEREYEFAAADYTTQ